MKKKRNCTVLFHGVLSAIQTQFSKWKLIYWSIYLPLNNNIIHCIFILLHILYLYTWIKQWLFIYWQLTTFCEHNCNKQNRPKRNSLHYSVQCSKKQCTNNICRKSMEFFESVVCAWVYSIVRTCKRNCNLLFYVSTSFSNRAGETMGKLMKKELPYYYDIWYCVHM